ncbi:MAG: hypothetical protein R6X12_05480 [bacterium]
MKSEIVRYGYAVAVVAVVLLGALAVSFGVARQNSVRGSDLTPAGMLVEVEATAEGPVGLLDEVVAVAEGPRQAVCTIDVVATALGPARGEQPVVEVRAARPQYAGIGRLPASGQYESKVN